MVDHAVNFSRVLDTPRNGKKFSKLAFLAKYTILAVGFLKQNRVDFLFFSRKQSLGWVLSIGARTSVATPKMTRGANFQVDLLYSFFPRRKGRGSLRPFPGPTNFRLLYTGTMSGHAGEHFETLFFAKSLGRIFETCTPSRSCEKHFIFVFYQTRLDICSRLCWSRIWKPELDTTFRSLKIRKIPTFSKNRGNRE